MYNYSYLFLIRKDPPQVELNIVNETYSQLNQDVELYCKSKCANPNSNLAYKWTNSENQVIQTGSNDKYIYKVQAQSVNDVFKVTCLISNGIESNNKDQSTIVFNIKYQMDNSSSTTTGNSFFFLLFPYSTFE